jgi:hypothetical protein
LRSCSPWITSTEAGVSNASCATPGVGVTTTGRKVRPASRGASGCGVCAEACKAATAAAASTARFILSLPWRPGGATFRA